jgi:hypothetical protein
MPLDRRQVKLRTMMLLVAITAATLACAVTASRLGERARQFRKIGRSHAASESFFRRQAAVEEDFLASYQARAERWRWELRNLTAGHGHYSPDHFMEQRIELTRAILGQAEAMVLLYRRSVRKLRRSAEYHNQLSRKYQIAASIPWESVRADLPTLHERSLDDPATPELGSDPISSPDSSKPPTNLQEPTLIPSRPRDRSWDTIGTDGVVQGGLRGVRLVFLYSAPKDWEGPHPFR